MSEYTTRQILDRIEANGGPEGLDLFGKDLSGIDLGCETIQAELKKVHEEKPNAEPDWWDQNPEWTDRVEAPLLQHPLACVNLEKANLSRANLQRSSLGGANLAVASLIGADLEGAVLWGANLEQAILVGANLKGANLFAANLEKASLSQAYLEGATLTGAQLQAAHLERADLTRATLLDAGSIQGIYLYRAILDQTQLTKVKLGGAIGEELDGECSKAKETYLALKNNFDQIGRYDDASWAYCRERRMEKREAWQEAGEAFRERHWRGAFGNGLKAASDQLVECVCDYGEGIWRVLVTLLVLWLVFALSYGVIAGVWGPWQETATGQIRYVTRNPIDLLSFSLGAMTTLVPADLEARSTLAMRVLMPLQAMLGIVLAGLLGFVLGNRIRRS